MHISNRIACLALTLCLPLVATAQETARETGRIPASTAKIPPQTQPEVEVDLDLGPAHTPPNISEVELTRRELLRALASADIVAAGLPTTAWSFTRGGNGVEEEGASLVSRLELDWNCGLTAAAASAPLSVRVPWNSERGSLKPAPGEVLLIAGEERDGQVVARDALVWNGRSVTLGYPRLTVPLTAEDLAALCANGG